MKGGTRLLDLKIDYEGTCKGCARGKNIKNPFLKSEKKTKGTLELIHSNVCGPIPSILLSGYDYYVTFMDDYSRKTWIYFLKNKSEVFRKFKEFKALIENHSEKRIKTLRLDNGGEYTSKEFEAFCNEDGIKRELTAAYNPQQNGVVERKNRTIMEALKTMIHDQELPCIYGMKEEEQVCLCKIDYLTMLLDSRLLNKCIKERNPK